LQTLLGSGNNLTVHADLTRRILICGMDADAERPELRQYKRNPKEEVLADRGKYVAAALTILRAFILARAAGAPRVQRLASFAQWSDLVASAIVWLGGANPVDTLNAARATDPVSEARLAIFAALHEAFGDAPFTTRDAGENPSVAETMREYFGKIVVDSNSIGAWLRHAKGTIAGGLKLAPPVKDRHTGKAIWAILKRL
jgi:putative DNA primase/helicase